MESLQYKIIKSKVQYKTYCKRLEELLDSDRKSRSIREEIDLLTLLIERYDTEHTTFADADPIQLLRSLMADHQLKATDLAALLDMSKGYVSDILNYKKGLSKEVIRVLATRFSISQEAFNRPYKLRLAINAHLRNASVMNTTKELIAA